MSLVLYFTSKEECVILMSNNIQPIQGENASIEERAQYFLQSVSVDLSPSILVTNYCGSSFAFSRCICEISGHCNGKSWMVSNQIKK